MQPVGVRSTSIWVYVGKRSIMKINIKIIMIIWKIVIQNLEGYCVTIRLRWLTYLRRYFGIWGSYAHHLDRRLILVWRLIIFIGRHSEGDTSLWGLFRRRIKVMINRCSDSLTVFHGLRFSSIWKMCILCLILASPSSDNLHFLPNGFWRNYILLPFRMRECFTPFESEVGSRPRLIHYSYLLLLLWRMRKYHHLRFWYL